MNLKHYLILLGGIAIGAPASARNPTTVPQLPGMSPRVHAVLNAKFQAYDRTARSGGGAAAAKTTATAQRVTGVANYQWTGTSPMIVDSSAISYSGTRGSKFGQYIPFYDLENPTDQPGPVEYQDTYVNFDTVKAYDYTTGNNAVRFRTYNAANKVTLSEIPSAERKVYAYLSNGNLSRVTLMYPGTTGLDSVQRDFITYGASGSIKDSIEVYDSSASAWMPVGNYVLTTTGTQVNSLSLEYNIGGSFLTLIRQDYTYNTSGKITLIRARQLDNSMTLVETGRDSLGYSGGTTMISEDYFQLDQNGGFGLSYRERRRLNAQGLADSISQVNVTGSASSDRILKLSYEANGYPAIVTTYNTTSTTPLSQARYYYQLNPNSVGNVRNAKVLSLAPNPAVNSIRLENKLGGSFRIVDLGGRLVMDGTIAPAAGISVEGLTPGMYSIQFSDASGEIFNGRFVKK